MDVLTGPRKYQETIYLNNNPSNLYMCKYVQIRFSRLVYLYIICLIYTPTPLFRRDFIKAFVNIVF